MKMKMSSNRLNTAAADAVGNCDNSWHLRSVANRCYCS